MRATAEISQHFPTARTNGVSFAPKQVVSQVLIRVVPSHFRDLRYSFTGWNLFSSATVCTAVAATCGLTRMPLCCSHLLARLSSMSVQTSLVGLSQGVSLRVITCIENSLNPST